MAYWFNIDTGQVETDDTRSQDAVVLGPYQTFDDAARALQTAHERTEQADEEDRDWAERGAVPPGEWTPTDR